MSYNDIRTTEPPYPTPVNQDDYDALAARLAEAERQLQHCKEQASEGLMVEHDCPAMFACASIYAELATEADRAADSASAAPAVCHWDQDGEDCDTWHTDCGNFFCIIDDTPTANEFKHCCYCGKPLVDRPWTDSEDEDEVTGSTVTGEQK